MKKPIFFFFVFCIAIFNNLCASDSNSDMAPGAFAYFIKKRDALAEKAGKNSSSLANNPLAKSVGRQIYPGEGHFKLEDYFFGKEGFSEFTLESVSKKQ